MIYATRESFIRLVNEKKNALMSFGDCFLHFFFHGSDRKRKNFSLSPVIEFFHRFQNESISYSNFLLVMMDRLSWHLVLALTVPYGYLGAPFRKF